MIASSRDARIDALRGFALLGILLVNIQSFVWGGANPAGFLVPDATELDRAVFFTTVTFVNLKFMPLFAMLFGASFGLQLEKLKALAERPKAVFRRRMAFLFVFGLLHGVFFYFGDITQAYAVAGLVLLGYADRSPTSLVRPVALWWAGSLALMAVLAWGLADTAPDPAELADEVQKNFAVFTAEGYLAQLPTRVAEFVSIVVANAVGLPLVIALMLTGLLAQRAGWLTHPGARAWKWALAVGLVVGLPASLAYGTLQLSEAEAFGLGAYPVEATLPGTASVVLAFAYASLFMTRAPAAVIGWFAAAGRMPLSNYLLQSLAMGALLSGWGLALATRLTYAQMALVALAIFAVQVVISRAWLARFEQGPLERLWRAWTYRGMAARASPSIKSAP